MAKERRRAARRTGEDRRSSSATAIDVTRLEHENICGQIDELLRSVRRIEQEMWKHRACIAALESDLSALMTHIKKSA